MSQEKSTSSSNETQRHGGRRYFSWFDLMVTAITMALAIWVQISSPIDPFPSFSLAIVETSPPDEQDPLRSAEHIFQDLYAPEDGFILDGDEWIWSLSNGELCQVNMKTMESKKFAQTGKSHELYGQLFMEEHCGRPLGLLKLSVED